MIFTFRSLGGLCRFGLLGSVLWIASCRTTPPPEPPPQEAAKKPTGLFEYPEGKGISHIRINIDEQKAYLYEGKDQVGWTYVATGIHSFPTPTGNFKVMEKVQNKVSNLYGKGYNKDGKLVNSDFKVGRDLLPSGGRFEAAKMTYFMRLTGDGVGMHIGPIPRPGKRASHGCIRLPAKVAGRIFSNVAVGTPVAIEGTGPDYKSYMAQSNKKARENANKLAAAKKKAEEEIAKAEAGTAPVSVDGAPAPTTGTTPATGEAAAANPAPETAPPSTPATPAPATTPAPAPAEEVKPAAPAPSAQ